jgi:uncharacterized membrane protein YgcG
VVERAHGRFVALIEGDDRQPVLLDLRPAVERVDQSLEDRGIDLIDESRWNRSARSSPSGPSQIDDVRETVDLARRLVIALPIVALVLIAAAVALAPDRRRMMARAGVGIIVAMVLTAVARASRGGRSPTGSRSRSAGRRSSRSGAGCSRPCFSRSAAAR